MSKPSTIVNAWETQAGETWLENLTDMELLSNESLLAEIKRQYAGHRIYTYVGDILCAVNPFCRPGGSDGLDSKATEVSYKDMTDLKALPPHIFAMATNAYNKMIDHHMNQCVAVSGESGAGKTEAAKYFIKQICNCSSGGVEQGDGKGLEQKLQGVNPILEAMGNSKTAMNNNSSRFGRYTEIDFTKEGAICGASITEYLLEKSRVCTQGEGEQTFHIFYLLWAYVERHPSLKDKFKLENPWDYPYLQQATGHSRPAVFDAMHLLSEGGEIDVDGVEFKVEVSAKEIDECLEILHISEQDASDIFGILAAIVKISTITFENDDQDISKMSSDEAKWEEVCELLGMNAANLKEAFLKFEVKVGSSVMDRFYKADQSKSQLDAMSKMVYANLFHDIITEANKTLYNGSRDVTGVVMGVLDIFGFEDFERGKKKGQAMNSVEQLCINLANEQLQFFFMEHIFGLELESYRQEGIDGSSIVYNSNQPTLDMLCGMPMVAKDPKGDLKDTSNLKKAKGVFPTLNEATTSKQAQSDVQFFDTLKSRINIEPIGGKADKKTGYEPQFIPSKFGTPEFQIVHYAGVVNYNCKDWIEKNKDSLPELVQANLMQSINPIVRKIFGGTEIARVGGGMKVEVSEEKAKNSHRQTMSRIADKKTVKKTLAMHFVASLGELMEKLNAAEPQFVRCLKPNQVKTSWEFEDEYVMRQLLYTGMMDTCSIRQKGYPIRPTFEDFMERYKIIGHPMSKVVEPSASACSQILSMANIEVGPAGAQPGKTRVFMKYTHNDQLRAALGPYTDAAKEIGLVGKGMLARMRYKTARKLKEEQDVKVASFIDGITAAVQSFAVSVSAALAEDAKFPKLWEDRIAEQKAAEEAAEKALADAKAAGDQAALEQAQQKADELAAKKSAEATKAAAREEIKIDVATKSDKQMKRRAEMIAWYKDQADEMGAGKTEDDQFQPWFHGVISRTDAGSLLAKQPDGTFLIRVAESRVGYSLSMMWKARVKHFAIDIADNGKHIIRGNKRQYKFLNQLISFHKTHSITDAGDKLLYPCNPGGDRADLLELI
eukprot:m.131735 g.131735  ORF g.131735 m.131735 type:complete len:1059 (-) comp29563_c0_seq1:99-3275(-)